MQTQCRCLQLLPVCAWSSCVLSRRCYFTVLLLICWFLYSFFPLYIMFPNSMLVFHNMVLSSSSGGQRKKDKSLYCLGVPPGPLWTTKEYISPLALGFVITYGFWDQLFLAIQGNFLQTPFKICTSYIILIWLQNNTFSYGSFISLDLSYPTTSSWNEQIAGRFGTYKLGFYTGTRVTGAS